MAKTEIVNQVMGAFQQRFSQIPQVFHAPGRVNIIGEHTDYNEGFVLPAAIDKAIYVAVAKRDDKEIHLYSLEFQSSFRSHLDELRPVAEGWPNYILGVAAQLSKRGYQSGGFNLVFHGDVPIGSGLSSSAAVECATAYALNSVYDLKIPPLELAFIAQKAEHEFAGVMCGIMDQFASIFGKKDHAIQLDCRSMEYRYIPLEMEGHKIVLFNTNVRHSLASTEYNTRREQCERGVAMVREHVKEVKSLRDVTQAMLEKYVSGDPIIFRRCSYVINENLRLLEATDHLKKGDLPALGELMFRSHEGLSEEYEVSCKELDFLVNYVKHQPGVIGARMMGGGFGGCTINIIEEEKIDSLTRALKPAYNQAMHLDLDIYIAKTGEGAGEVNV